MLTSIQRPWRFLRFVFRRFVENDGFYRSSALTFTTLLAIVPLMSVGVTILSAFPVFQSVVQPVQNFIFDNFVPNTGKVVQEYLAHFAEQASQLSIWGLAFLIITAILMMHTIESAFNKIWEVRDRRHGVAAFLLYWGVLSLAPLLMGISFAISSYFVSAKIWAGAVGAIGLSKTQLLNWAPLFLSFGTFTLLYLIVPYCPVRWWHAISGACVTAILLEAAKWVFGYYLKRFGTYELVYGAFAAVPIFFLWIYWVWVIVLLGAEIAHGMSVDYQRRPGNLLPPFQQALRWLHYLWDAQRLGNGMSLAELIASDLENYELDPESCMQTLVALHLVTQTESKIYYLSRDLSRMRFGDLYDLLPWRLPTQNQLNQTKHPLDAQFGIMLAELADKSKSVLERPLIDLFE